MALPFLGEIERLINERGSAAIMRERLALANDQYVALERKLAECEARAQRLEAENQRFELENLRLKERTRALEAQIADRQGARLDEMQEKILQLLPQHGSVTDRQIAAILKSEHQLAVYHLEELRKKKFVDAAHFAGSDWAGEAPRSEWHLAQPGRAYLVARGLLK